MANSSAASHQDVYNTTPNGESPRKKRKTLLFDESVTDAQRRRLRQQQRKLHATLVRNETTFDDAHKESQSQFSQVSYPREAVLDASNVEALAANCVKEVESKAQVARYDPLRFINALKHKCADSTRSFDWHRLGVEAGVCVNAVPWARFGRWAQEPKERKARAARQVRVAECGPAEKPEENVRSKSGDHSSHTAEKAVKDMNSLLVKKSDELQKARQRDPNSKVPENEKGSMDGVLFLVDTESFTQTVENFFYFSFLVKNGLAGIRTVPNQNKPAELGQRLPNQRLLIQSIGSSEETPSPARQLIMSLTMRDWRRLVALKKKTLAA